MHFINFYIPKIWEKVSKSTHETEVFKSLNISLIIKPSEKSEIPSYLCWPFSSGSEVSKTVPDYQNRV